MRPSSQEEGDLQCCQNTSILHVIVKAGAEQTSLASFITMPRSLGGGGGGGLPDWEQGLGGGWTPSAPAFVPLSLGCGAQVGWSTSCLWLQWES